MLLMVRGAKRAEIEWVNTCYDEVEFMHSIFDNEIIAVAEMDGIRAGIGRLIAIDSDHFELGGMYVFEFFRNQGVARAIVDFLLENKPPDGIVYCIPFEYLVPFYKRFGFVSCQDFNQVPKAILDKYLWCKEKYSHPTSLLILSDR